MRPELDVKAIVDGSKMSAAQRQALEVCEAACELRRDPCFAASLLVGEPDFSMLKSRQSPSLEERDQGDAFLAQLQRKLSPPNANPESIKNRCLQAKLGALDVPVRHDGLGLSLANQLRAASAIGRHCEQASTLGIALDVIGVSGLIRDFGTSEQKRAFLPRFAAGEGSAFALAEQHSANPKDLITMARPASDGEHYVLSGEKLCHASVAGATVFIVIACTPVAHQPDAITVFLVEDDRPGVQIHHRSQIKDEGPALENRVLKLKRVMVPKAHILGELGGGMEVLKGFLGRGRLARTAMSAGLTSGHLDRSLHSASLLGSPFWKVNHVAKKKVSAFVMEALVQHFSTSRPGHRLSSLECMMANAWTMDRLRELSLHDEQVNDAVPLAVAAFRDEVDAAPTLERLFTEGQWFVECEAEHTLMRRLIMEEMMEPHLRVGAGVVNASLPAEHPLRSAVKAASHFDVWLPVGTSSTSPHGGSSDDPWTHLARLSRKLARRLFFAMSLHGAALPHHAILTRCFVDIGAELFALSIATAHAQNEMARTDTSPAQREHVSLLIRCAASMAFTKVEALFHRISDLCLPVAEHSSRKAWAETAAL